MNTKLYFLILLLFSIGLHKQGRSQQYVWAKSLAGRGVSTLDNLTPGTSNAEAIAVDTMGNVYLTGYCNDTVDFDPGPNILLLDAGNDDVYLAKYDSAGNYLWAHVFKSAGHNYGTHLKLDKQGNIVIMGYGQSTADFDPGPNTFLLGNLATANYLFIAKYDANGNFIWGKEIGNNFGTLSGGLDIDLNNNICITGYFYGTMDMDPGPDAASLVSNQSGIFTAKYNQDGNYIWANCLSGIGNLGTSLSVACSVNGNVFIAGLFGNTVDFDPGPDTVNITANTTCDRFFIKYNPSGNFIWVKTFDVNENGYLNSDRMIKIALDNDENVYLTGNFSGNVDFNPGAGVFSISSPLTTSSYICKYTPAGQFMWAKGLIGGVVQTTDMVLDCQNNICLTGSFSKADFDPSPVVKQVLSTAPSAFNNFYAKYSNSGDLIWVNQVGNNGYGGSTLSAYIALHNGNLFLAGGFKQTGSFNPDGTGLLQASGVGQNSFFAKYSVINSVNNLHDTTLCAGQHLTLDASAMQGTYLWQNQSTHATFEVTHAGQYWVEVTTENCKTRDSIIVAYNLFNPLNFHDSVICEGSTILLSSGNAHAQHLWQDNSTAATFEVTAAGTFWITETEAHCSMTDTIKIETKACESCIEFPTVFTPNGDGLNETFIPIKMKGIYQPELLIYNRWGQKVYGTNDIQKGWDGSVQQQKTKTPSGVYYWVFSYITINNEELQLNGFVTLMN